ncbi:putative arabinogalactan endo-beta-1 [Hyphodiscus hymeniophilus]|uniref:Arabinogalactan endo-beta-1,4-galactanase n=1 Tax=Hyphodiscus hymeniophilus TaxID=353542 RepID=A0A9P6VLF9_9HELO|nr:putative arabinogalactan endo-beta-1 [Hyphodiscus hymeniophilus]
MHLWNFLLLLLPLAAAIPSQPKQALRRSGEHPNDFFYKGHDLSSLLMLEEGDCIYKDTARNNETRPAEAILGDGGMNSVRLRIWVNPVGGTYGLHADDGSDSWADPNKQLAFTAGIVTWDDLLIMRCLTAPPAAWPTSLIPLATTLRAYVKDTLVSFKQAGINLDLVALGNEIRHGLLWPAGYADVDVEPWPETVRNFSSLAYLWKAARAGVDDAIYEGVPKPQVLIHIDDGWNLTLQQRWFSAMVENGVPTSAWDVFGFSFYPFYGTAATFANLRTTLNTLAEEYRKPIQVVETDYPAVCNGEYNPIPPSSEPEIPYSIAGQTEWTDDVISIVQQVPYGLGRGVHYWEPAWLNGTSLGSNCSDAILFQTDYSAYPLTVGYSRSSVGMFKVRT